MMSYKKSLLVICKISRLFTNTLNARGKYSLFNRDNLTQLIQMQLSRKEKTFSEFFSAFLRFSLNFEHFQEKDDSHSWDISEITQSEKQGWINIYKDPFQGILPKATGKRAKTLFKFEWQNLYHIYWLLWRQLTFKKYLLVIWKISRLFPNTLSADGKYSLLNRDNLTQPIQMQLSRKQKTFSEFFSAFLKSSLNFEHFLKKDDPHCWCISEITDPEKPC